MWITACRIHVLWQQWANSHGLQKPCGEKGTADRGTGPERARPLSGQAFIAFLGTLHPRMVLIYYAVGDYLLQITKERMLLITSKRRIKRESG